MQITENVIKQIKAYDQKVLLELYHYSFNVLMQVVSRYKNNRSDQMTLVNNTFMKIINNIHTFQLGTNYQAWVKKIIRNEIIDDYRKNKKNNPLIFTDNFINEGISVDEINLDQEIEEQKLLHLLQLLPPATRLVFTLYALDEMKPRVICEQLKLSSETVKWHLSEARKKLKAQLALKHIQ